ncbi:hypothetical protein JYT28_01115 [Desulfobulbus sp. AH-315-M07]|nr:hypothetical protein [Desulfobulbus sp. AH-315-M07]
MSEQSFRLFNCERCNQQVTICRSCDYGNIYCADGCAEIRRRESRRRAGAKYQRTRPHHPRFLSATSADNDTRADAKVINSIDSGTRADAEVIEAATEHAMIVTVRQVGSTIPTSTRGGTSMTWLGFADEAVTFATSPP